LNGSTQIVTPGKFDTLSDFAEQMRSFVDEVVPAALAVAR
jgi:hypothetical protein